LLSLIVQNIVIFVNGSNARKTPHVLFPCDGCDIMSDSMDIYFFSPWGPTQNDDDNALHATRAEHKLCQPTTRQQNVMNEAPDVQ